MSVALAQRKEEAMKKAKLLGTSVISGAVAGALLLSSGTVSAQYNPYPPGILPPDIVSETARVRREIQGIFNQALAEWQALTPPTLTGQPPTLQGTGYQAVQTLGKIMNFDENMSTSKNVACSFCHMPYAG